jgi:outer membrane protein assembly factor BamB
MAIDPESGRVVWETSSPSDMSIWTVLDDRLYGAIYNSMLYGLDPQDGRVLWRFKNNGALFRADPVAFEGGIIFATGTQLVWGGRGAQGYLFSILPGARTAPGKH